MQKFHCEKCDSDIVIPDLKENDKSQIMNFLNSNNHVTSILLIPIIHKMTGLSMKDSKSLFLHINKKTVHCHRCNYEKLNSENVICPKCKSFNTNWK